MNTPDDTLRLQIKEILDMAEIWEGRDMIFDDMYSAIMHLIDQHTADAVAAARVDEAQKAYGQIITRGLLRVNNYLLKRIAELQARNTQ